MNSGPPQAEPLATPERITFSVSSHYIGNHDDEAAEEAAAAVVQGAYLKFRLRLNAFAFIPLAAGALAHGWITLCAIRALGELPVWARWFAGAALLAPVAFAAITIVMRRRAKDTATIPPLPNLTDLTTGSEWLWRLTNTPIVPLSIIYLNHTGWHPAAAYGAATVGWLGHDLASLLSLPARRTLHRLTHLMRPLPKNTPEM
jgi:hypothetical protein